MSSVFGVLSMLDRLRYQADLGEPMFGVFFAILSFPLCIVIPFGLFRSMTSEFVGSTWELLVITPMKASKIVRGKLATAMLQAALYMALLAPFLCFTWLLKGVGDDTHPRRAACCWSSPAFLTLCHLALFCGSLVRKAAWQGFGMIILMAGSLFAWGALLIGVVSQCRENQYGDVAWWRDLFRDRASCTWSSSPVGHRRAASLTPTYPADSPVQQPGRWLSSH